MENFFLEAYHNMSKPKANGFKQESMAYFNWSSSTFYNKVNGGKLRPFEERDWTKIVNKYLQTNYSV